MQAEKDYGARCGGVARATANSSTLRVALQPLPIVSHLRSMLIIAMDNGSCASRIERVGNFDGKRKQPVQVQRASRNHPVMEKGPADHRAEILGPVVGQVNECRALGCRLGWQLIS